MRHANRHARQQPSDLNYPALGLALVGQRRGLGGLGGLGSMMIEMPPSSQSQSASQGYGYVGPETVSP